MSAPSLPPFAAASAVFLSYAREDAEAARRLAEALRAAGVEVWFDQSELVGGDVWDAKIRRQIKECTLFLPVISANTQARTEGYFRLEWRLAEQRTHLMAKGRPFLLPVVFDDTRETGAHVPDSFLDVQWTRLGAAAGDDALAGFCGHVKSQLAIAASGGTRPGFAGSAAPMAVPPGAGEPTAATAAPAARVPPMVWAGVVAAAVLLAVFALRERGHEPGGPAPAASVPAGPAAAPTAAAAGKTAPADKSVAVLPFENLSGDKENDFFADGVSEELINALGRVPGLTVKGRASAFYFKGRQERPAEIARQLGVAYLVLGSVRRAGGTVRITAQLTRATTDEVVWSAEPLNREAKDVFAVQEEIAGLIARSLSLTIGAAPAARAVNPEAFDLHVQARQAWNQRTAAGYDRAEELLHRALALEPGFARAHAALADVWSNRAQDAGQLGRFDSRGSPEQVRIVAKVREALALDPDSAEALASLGVAHWLGWELADAARELRRAVALNPNYASAHQWLGRVLLADGRVEESLAALQRAADLDPLSTRILDNYALANFLAGRFTPALALYDRALAVQPGSGQALAQKAWLLAELGRREEAAVIARALPSGPASTPAYRVLVLARAGEIVEAAGWIAELIQRRHDRAWTQLALGQPAAALEQLDADGVQATTIEQWLFAPLVDGVRGDPRFAQFLATLGLTEAHARAQAWRAAHPPQKTAR
ncbi:MAG: TIR domain-containing protein [Verrucomicrobia bacterium]|nr:TIR domain-containing protein [Verrucomicrobiota bacterium]